MSESVRKRISWGPAVVHGVFWAVYLYFLYTFYLSNDITTLALRAHPRFGIFILRVVWDISLFYIVYYFISRWLAKGKAWWFVGLTVGLLLVGTALRTAFGIWWIDQSGAAYANPVVNADLPMVQQFGIRSLSSLFVIIMAGIGRFTFDWFRQQRERKELETQRLSSELAFLKSQVNPHFLFNTLNNIYGLARKHSPDTEGAILKLSGLMRYMLYETDTPEVSLTREVQQLHDYISLQSLRYAKPEVARVAIAGSIDAIEIAPLLLVPLVENGFKHGRFSQPDDQLDISLQVEEGELIFQVENPTVSATETKDEVGGVGLENIRRRLEILYAGRYTLTTEEENGRFRATLLIQGL